MSKKAEELAMDAYPGQMFTTCARGNRFAAGPLFRGAFIRGYEQAEKDIKDTLLEWAKEKAELYKGTANIRRSFEMMIRKIESL